MFRNPTRRKKLGQNLKAQNTIDQAYGRPDWGDAGLLEGHRLEHRSSHIEDLVESTGATLVQQIGQVICLYRRHPENPRIALPR